jgi:multiple sugar transport system substrate-binding protein
MRNIQSLRIHVLFFFLLLLSQACTSSAKSATTGPVEASTIPPTLAEVKPIPPTLAGVKPITGENQATLRFACYSFERSGFEDLAKEFHAQNPSVSVEIVAIEDVIGDDYETGTEKLVSAADTAFFLVEPLAAAQGLLLDLTPLIDADPGFEAEDFFPHTLEAFQWNDRMWALPSQAYLKVIFYDKDLFDKAKIAYPAMDWKRSDFLDLVQGLTLKAGGETTQYGFVDVGGEASQVFVEYLARDHLRQGQLDSPEVAAAIQWYLDLELRYHVVPEFLMGQEGLDQNYNLLQEEKAAMWSSFFMNYESYRRKKRHVGMAPFPTDGEAVVHADMYGYMISAGTAHPQEAWLWLNFLTRHQLTGEHSLFAGQLPSRRSVAEETHYWDQFDKETIDLVRYAAEHLVFPEFDPARRSSLVWDAERAVRDGQPIESALADAQAAYEQRLAEIAQMKPIPVVVAAPTPAGASDKETFLFAPYGPDAETLRGLAAEFNQEQDEIQVQIGNPGDADRADCYAAASTENSPLNLQPLWEADAALPVDEFYPSFLEAFRSQGDLQGMPIQAQARVIFFNRDLFDAAGLPYPKPGWTSDDFLSSAIALTQDGSSGKQYGFLSLNGEAGDLPIFVALQGGSLWDEAGQPRFDAPEVVSAVRWYTDLAFQYGVMPVFPGDSAGQSPTDMDARYALVHGGRVAMWTDFTGVDRAGIWPANVGIAPLPAGERKITDFLYQGMFISSDTPHVRACWEWIKYASGQPGLVQGLPVRRDTLDSAEYQVQVGAETLETYAAIVEEYSDINRLWNANAPQVYWLNHALMAIFNGSPVEDALTNAQREAEE